MKLSSSPIFIIGTQRSGSNLLRLLLCQSNEIFAPHPPHILQNYIPLLDYYGNLSNPEAFKKLVFDVVDFVNQNPVKWERYINPQLILQLSTKKNIFEILKVIYQYAASYDNAAYWCCKSMFNVHYMRDLENNFQKPFYIYLYRDGRDVANSFKNCLVGEKHVYYIAKQWKIEQDLAFQSLQFIDSERIVIIKYEELISNPKVILESVFFKLGLKWEDEFLNFYTSNEARRTANSGEMWAKLTEPIDSNNSDKYKTSLTKEEILIFESVTFDTLNRLGYKSLFKKNELISISKKQLNTISLENEVLKMKARVKFYEECQSRLHQESIINKIKSGY
jgi:hypothetical protein